MEYCNLFQDVPIAVQVTGSKLEQCNEFIFEYCIQRSHNSLIKNGDKEM